MFFVKKIATRRGSRDNEPIDFFWIIYIGMNKLGFSYRQVKQMYFGSWVDFYEIHKKQYNFETKRALYVIPEEEEPISSLSIL